uniref:Uncharacterized protein n=1 Tax=Chenopodium quinoa TaxID=63459 RepID=A0A803MBY8_CHEQI
KGCPRKFLLNNGFKRGKIYKTLFLNQMELTSLLYRFMLMIYYLVLLTNLCVSILLTSWVENLK